MARSRGVSADRVRHVLQVFPYYLSPEIPNVSGVKTSVLALVRGLADKGVASTVLVPAANPAYDRDFLAAGARAVVELGLTRHLVFERHRADIAYLARYPTRLVSEARAVRELLPKLKVDLVHSHGSAFVGACRAAKRVGLPSVLHVHEDVVRLPDWAARQYLRRAPYLADRLVCCAEYLSKQFLDAGAPHARVVTVPNVVDTRRFTSEGSRNLRIELGVGPKQVLVGFVGRLVPGKDPARFVRAARLAAPRVRHTRFVVVGGTDDPKHDHYVAGLHRVADDGLLGGHVSFARTRDDIPDVLRSLDVFVMCSHNEAMPNTVLEAMASGCAVVDQSGGGSAEALGGGSAGRLVKGKDAGHLAEAIVEVVANEAERRALSLAARRRAEEVYSFETMAPAVLAIYEELLGAHQGARAVAATGAARGVGMRA